MDTSGSLLVCRKCSTELATVAIACLIGWDRFSLGTFGVTVMHPHPPTPQVSADSLSCSSDLSLASPAPYPTGRSNIESAYAELMGLLSGYGSDDSTSSADAQSAKRREQPLFVRHSSGGKHNACHGSGGSHSMARSLRAWVDSFLPASCKERCP